MVWTLLLGFNSVTSLLISNVMQNHLQQFTADGSIAVPADLLFLGGGLNSEASRNAKAVFVEASNQYSDQLE